MATELVDWAYLTNNDHIIKQKDQMKMWPTISKDLDVNNLYGSLAVFCTA